MNSNSELKSFIHTGYNLHIFALKAYIIFLKGVAVGAVLAVVLGKIVEL